LLAAHSLLLLALHGLSLVMVAISWLVAVEAIARPAAGAQQGLGIGATAILALWLIETAFARRHRVALARAGTRDTLHRELAWWPLQAVRFLTSASLVLLLGHQWVEGLLLADPRWLLLPSALLLLQFVLLIDPQRILAARVDEDQLTFLKVRQLACHAVALAAATSALAIQLGLLISEWPLGVRYLLSLQAAVVVAFCWISESWLQHRCRAVIEALEGPLSAIHRHRERLARLPLHAFYFTAVIGILALAGGSLGNEPWVGYAVGLLVFQLVHLAEPWRIFGEEQFADECSRQQLLLAQLAFLVIRLDRWMRGRSTTNAPSRRELLARARLLFGDEDLLTTPSDLAPSSADVKTTEPSPMTQRQFEPFPASVVSYVDRN
jgi:hypothetical protein